MQFLIMKRMYGYGFFILASLLTLPMFTLIKLSANNTPLYEVLGLHFIVSCLSLLPLIAVMFSGLSMVLSQQLVKKTSPLMISFYAIFAGALIHLPLVLFWDFSKLSLLPIASGILFAMELYCFTTAFRYLSTESL